MLYEKILRIEVTHVPSLFGTPAHIRIIGLNEHGPFTIRKISGLRTDTVTKKMEAARILFERLIGLEVKVIERPFTRGTQPPSIKRIVVATSLPEWARGDWAKITKTATT